MGVHKFKDIFKPTATVKTIEKRAAIDAMVQLFSSSSMQYAAGLTNSAGESTLYLQTILRNVVKRLDKDDVWVWDSGHDADSIKQKAIAQRTVVKASNVAEIDALRDEIERLKVADLSAIGMNAADMVASKQSELNVLLARNPDASSFKRMKENIIYILNKLGVRMTHAPRNYDAEQLCTQLCRERVVECVISTDTDIIMYGAPELYKKVPNKPEYNVYTLESCMRQHDLTYEQLVEIATVMGCDFCAKTPGVGDKTVVRRVKAGIELTDEQKRAKARFMNHAPLDYKMETPARTKEGVRELMAWLVERQNFDPKNVEKILGHLIV